MKKLTFTTAISTLQKMFTFNVIAMDLMAAITSFGILYLIGIAKLEINSILIYTVVPAIVFFTYDYICKLRKELRKLNA